MGEFKVHHVRFMDHSPLAIHCMAYDKHSRRLALSRSDGSVEVWSKNDKWFQEKVIGVCAERSVEGLEWMDSRLFSAGLDGNVVEYDLAALAVKRQASSFAGAVWCLTKNEGEHQLAAGTEDGCVVLFDASNDDLQYLRAFDKLEGRILCIAWQTSESVIVTGGADNIRIWGAKSGHAIQRILLGRKDTTVWCLAITSDLTIISGDSRGKISFWNGKQGTRITHFQSHKADILTLCVGEDERSVYCAGVDPAVVEYRFMAPSSGSGWRSWVRTSARTYHSHDVRTSLVADGCIVTGGMDTNIIVRSVGSGTKYKHTKIPAIPAASLVSVARESDLLLLRFPTYLEIWRLGSAVAGAAKDGVKDRDILPLRTSQLKLLKLQARPGERIACSAISDDGTLLAFSDHEKLRVHRLTLDDATTPTPKVSMSRLSLDAKDNVTPAQCLAITPDAHHLLAATSTGALHVWELSKDGGGSLLHSVPCPGLEEGGRHSFTAVCVSDNGRLAATSDTSGGVHLYNIKKGEVESSLPRLQYQATSIAFTPAAKILLVAYADHSVYEYNIAKQEYSEWSRQHSHRFPDQWQRQRGSLRGLAPLPNDPQTLILHNEETLFLVNRYQSFPEANYALFPKGPPDSRAPRPLVACNRYKFIMHIEPLSKDTLVVVERTPAAIHDSLEKPLRQKKFGT